MHDVIVSAVTGIYFVHDPEISNQLHMFVYWFLYELYKPLNCTTYHAQLGLRKSVSKMFSEC